MDRPRERRRDTPRLVLGINADVRGHRHRRHPWQLVGAAGADNLGDALTYGLSQDAVSRGAEAKVRGVLFKGGLALLAALTAAGRIVYRVFGPGQPLLRSRAFGPGGTTRPG